MTFLRASLLAGLVLSLASRAGAEIVVYAHGGFQKVTSATVDGDRVELVLPSGGRMSVGLLQVARILEDEVPPADAVDEAALAPSFRLSFGDAQAAPDGPYSELIYATARRHDLNPELLHAVVRAESAFRPDAVSHKGAGGLMQLMPATAHRFGLTRAEVFEPARNLDAGARYLRWLAERFDDRLTHVLAGYNAGEGTVDRYRGVPPYRETRNYVRKIYRFLGLGDPEAEATVVADAGAPAASPAGVSGR